MPGQSSFYTDCTDTGRPLDAYDSTNTLCLATQKLFEKRQIFDGGASRRNCKVPTYIHHVGTGEWAECCAKPKPPKPGTSRWTVLAKGLLGDANRGNFLSCRPLEPKLHRYKFDLRGVGHPDYTCGHGSTCDQPEQVCLMPATIGESVYAPRGRSVCLGVGKAGKMGEVVRQGTPQQGTLQREVYYFISPWPFLLPATRPAADLESRVSSTLHARLTHEGAVHFL